MAIQIAIDGPAGSGKSSICKLVAKKLDLIHIDTGAMFRAVTLYALERQIDLADEQAYDFLDSIQISYENNKIYLNGKNVSERIREADVTENVSQVSKIKRVRDKMLVFERELAKTGNVIMDGRDIASVVLPDADIKIFLTASVETRAKRRYDELISKGKTDVSLESVEQDIILRDKKDSTREIAPLTQTKDSILVDSTNMSIEEVCNRIIEIIQDKVGFKMSQDVKEINSMDDVEFGKKLRKGQIVKGEVVSVEDDVCYLDLHEFTEGQIYLEYFTLDKTQTSLKNLVSVGDEIEVEITGIEEGDLSGRILCSRLRLLRNQKFQDLVTLFENKTPITVTVTKVLKDNKGYMVDYDGLEILMPRSQSPRNVNVKDSVEGILIEVNPSRRRAVFSYKTYQESVEEENKQAELASIKEGDVLEGEVVKILPFACFIKFNYIQGMLRLSEVSHLYIDKIEDELKVGDKVQVKVLAIKNNKLVLSRKVLLPTPYEEYVKGHKVGEVVKAKVVNKLPYGILLELAPNVRGLLHQSEYSWNPNDNYQSYVKLEDEIEVVISNIDIEKQKISLSRKAMLDNPWSRVKAKVGDVCDCKIEEINEYGLKVSTLGVDGFIPNNAILDKDIKGKVSDYYAVGDEVKAVIFDIKPKEWVLRLSIRRYKELEEHQELEKYLTQEDEDTGVTLGDKFQDILK